MISTTAATEPGERRQCWECRRRRLVCDSSRPACNKCLAAGTECPGYGSKKPLKWITPGTVKSRNRGRPPGSGKGSTSAAKTKSMSKSPQVDNASISVGSSLSAESSLTTNCPDGAIDRLIQEAEAALQSEQDPLNPVTFLKSLGLETNDFFQSVLYFNDCIYPDLAVMHELVPNPYLAPIPMMAFRDTSSSVRHTICYLTLGHRIQQLAWQLDEAALVEERSRLYHHRGEAMRALSEDISNDRSQCATQLILLRGGLKKLVRTSAMLRPSLLYFMIIGVMGNTTSSASDQIPATSNLDLIDLMAEAYGEGLFPVLFCPPTLLLDIIRINHLRMQGSTNPTDEILQTSAYTLLEQIQSFSPEQWTVTSAAPRDEWHILGRIYQSAILVYCISSLQSVCLLPSSTDLNNMKAAHGSRLLLQLRKAMMSPAIKKCMTWPLVVAGVQAVSLSATARTFVTQQLTEMSLDVGSPIPLTARDVLKKFWDSGNTAWDVCFDQPYAFVS
ncbi:Zn(II)2Cys6 transcription factor [Aspergillus tanneri]|uniref:Zn(2)-C6 fungal-type domain-containing protein n=1 Tax=Aspergillus tanneri TaxID=1220188 RepID=A0A5M9M3B3_9EURO|nr:uncharacterized protein ATNIH1004_001940 [Aspergillus tanneri]KAA8641475.1 hypothetical protein ATNIH1004_001940 [Aspergillus tanneri]